MLHIFNGDTSLDLFRESGLPGEGRVVADVLHSGRLLADPTSSEFTSERIQHAVEMGLARVDEAAALHAEWRRGLAAAAEHEEVVLWFEHDLFDQLLLLHHIEWLWRTGVPGDGGTAVSLICIGEFEGIPDFAGLGQLSPAQFATLFPQRAPLSAGQVSAARDAWSAVTGEDPRAIEAIVTGGTPALPFLDGALIRLLEEYPHMGSGLSRTELQALRAVAEGAGTPRGAFRAQAAMEERIFLGDSTFLQVLRRLAGAREPLLVLEMDAVPEEGPALPAGIVSLTPFGREVLADRADHAVVNGVDRWVGGVRLHGTSPRWRWNAGSRGIEGPFEGSEAPGRS